MTGAVVKHGCTGASRTSCIDDEYERFKRFAALRCSAMSKGGRPRSGIHYSIERLMKADLSI